MPATMLLPRVGFVPRFLPAFLGHVPELAADVGLICLDRADELLKAAFVPCLTETVEHEPRGFLRNLQVAMQLHAGHALEVGDVEVDGEGPLAQGKPGTSSMVVPVRTLK